MKVTQHNISVTKRTVYEGRRKRIVYDANCGLFFVMGQRTASVARAQIRADIAWCAANPGIEQGNCSLTPHGVESWCFVLRCNNKPLPASSMTFTAKNYEDAYVRVKQGYADHPDAQVFFAMPSEKTND